jgi:hypothetical protein
MICDVHAHYLPRGFSDYLNGRLRPGRKPVRSSLACRPFSDLPEDIGRRIDMMDEAGVGRQILSPDRPPYLLD